MMDKLSHTDYRPHPVIVRAFDVLFMLQAEHELNCSTAFARHLASSGVDVYSTIGGATAALYGPRHGGANEGALRMLEKIGKVENIPQFLTDVKEKKAMLLGFGHRIYKNYDPRALICKKVAQDVFNVVGRDSLWELALEVERQALADSYFVERRLFPNVDYYTGVIYKALGFPPDFFPILFALPLTAGWLAHWCEFLDDPENKIIRPQQTYKGSDLREYVSIDQRQSDNKQPILESATSSESRRRQASTAPAQNS